MKVFVSSTVYDLVDVRAEVSALLTDLGLTPMLSDEKLSGFDAVQDANSIETCLLNVDACDAVIVILDKRYGPRLGRSGFEDVSATHLEYRRAIKAHKTVFFYVRDRVEADFTINKRNGGNAVLSWVQDPAVLEFLQERRELKESARNWIYQFTNSIDLKQSIRRHFEPITKPQVLREAINQNRFPLFTNTQELEFINRSRVHYSITFTNASLAPAFAVRSRWDEQPFQDEGEIVAPGEQLRFLRAQNPSDATFFIELEFNSAIGVVVKTRYQIDIVDAAHQMTAQAKIVSRTYSESNQPVIHILPRVEE